MIMWKWKGKKKVPFISQGRVYKEYEKAAGWFIKRPVAPLEELMNIKAIYYRENNRRVDITNLNGALHDILTKYGVIKDDCFKYVGGTDGSRVRIDKDNPRTEVYITLLKE